MRSRILKPGFFDNPVLGKLDPFARILFQGLWCYADREGRFKWEPERIGIRVLPYDTSCDVPDLLESLRVSRLIMQYSVNGEEYGQVCKFKEHQRIHRRESPSKLPACENGTVKDSPGTVQGQAEDSPRCPASTSTSTSVIKLHSSSSTEAAELLKDLLLKEQPNAKIPKDLITGKRSWAAEIDRMIRIDNRDPPEILKMIRWIYNENLQNEFQFVVKSAQSLRKKYDNIETQMKKHEPRIAEDPHKDRKCKGPCGSWRSTMETDERGWCEYCRRDETLSPN